MVPSPLYSGERVRAPLPRSQANTTLPSSNRWTEVWPPRSRGLGFGFFLGFLSDALVYATGFHDPRSNSARRSFICCASRRVRGQALLVWYAHADSSFLTSLNR